MSKKRMFSLSVVDTDKFLEMPISSRLLYYELGMRADDDGFVDNWKKILMFTGLKEDDMKVLIAKMFIIPFETGVIVIRHWRMNNYLRNDRFNPTQYKEEMAQLQLDNNGIYNLATNGIPGGIHSIDKYSIDKYSIDNNIVVQVIDYLNQKLNSNYKSTTNKTKQMIHARTKEGFTLEDFKKVIDIKYNEWHNDKKMSMYLRPETLFGTKFESYLNQKEIKKRDTEEEILKYLEENN